MLFLLEENNIKILSKSLCDLQFLITGTFLFTIHFDSVKESSYRVFKNWRGFFNAK